MFMFGFNFCDDILHDSCVHVHFRYVAGNVTMSQGWRESHNGVLFDLHHRPLHLIQHIRHLSQLASSITKAMIRQVGEEKFKVSSVSNPLTEHDVVLCNETNNLPTCTCFSFRKSHILCKHFAAVFEHYQLSWNSLPASYRDHPLFVVDEQCIGFHPTDIEQPSKANDNWDVTDLPTTDDRPEMHCINDATDVKIDAVNDSLIRRTSTEFRELLGKLRSLSYLVRSAESFTNATAELKCIYDRLASSCPVSEGLLLESEDKTGKVTTHDAALRDLPVRKKNVGTQVDLEFIS
jgi:SWIM zinc finger